LRLTFGKEHMKKDLDEVLAGKKSAFAPHTKPQTVALYHLRREFVLSDGTARRGQRVTHGGH
jgi:hypothetical protein